MQSPQTHFHKACELLKEIVLPVKNMRNDYKELLASATELCLKWDISIMKPIKRKIYSKKHFRDIQGDRRLDAPEEKFRVSIFYSLVNTALFQLQNRLK